MAQGLDFADPTVVQEPDGDGAEEVELLASAPPGDHEPCLLQHPQVLHDAEAGRRHLLLKRAERLPGLRLRWQVSPCLG